MKITLTERVYTVDDNNYKRKFVDGANGISIPGTHGNGLHFSNAKKQMVKSFYTALGMFLEEIERTQKEEKNSPLISNEDFPFIPLSL